MAIFIIGAPRSGTSITTWALGQHRNIQPMPETAWIAGFAVDAYSAWQKGSERGRFSHLSNVEYPAEPFMARMGEGVHGVVCDVFEERCYRFYGDWRAKGEIRWNPENKNAAMQLRREIDDPKGRWVDGTPMNTPYAWGLRLLFPEAKFIHLLRRPEHVAASLTKFENVGAVSQDARQGIETWMDHVYYAIMTQEAFGSETVQLVEFEKLVEDPEPAIKRICDFLGEPYSADCLIPYGKKINSSEVDDKRAEIVENIKRLPSFAKADYLHGRAIAPETGASARMEAQQILQNFFLTQCARNHN